MTIAILKLRLTDNHIELGEATIRGKKMFMPPMRLGLSGNGNQEEIFILRFYNFLFCRLSVE
jgi:hypothetical protein